ncbi:MAG: hypothetical protein QOH66_2124 [Actinomycetota bacterium]|nr:hypothetical protein [Actinomycetota bacterium]
MTGTVKLRWHAGAEAQLTPLFTGQSGVDSVKKCGSSGPF